MVSRVERLNWLLLRSVWFVRDSIKESVELVLSGKRFWKNRVQTKQLHTGMTSVLNARTVHTSDEKRCFPCT